MSIKNFHLFSLVFNQPHLCTPEYAETVLHVLGDKVGVDPSMYTPSEQEKNKMDSRLVGSTYVLPIQGSMTHKAGFLDAASGMSSYEGIRADLEQAVADPKVKSILLDMDSSGGSVAGAFDLKDYISSIDKPTYALARDNMCSAAYLISSACDKVYTTQTGSVGSIGVVAMHVDQSKANEDKGIKPTFIHAGAYKTAGNPHEALEGEKLDYLQQSVNDSYEMFVNAVAETRGMDVRDIRDTEARVYRGEKAVEIGLADGVRTFEAALEELANISPKRVSTNPYSTKGTVMENEEMTLEAAVAEVTKLKADNEGLRKQVLDAGFKITAEGLVAPEVAEAPEMIEVAGVLTDKATLPDHVVEALETAAEEKATAELKELASTELPNFRVEAAMAFMKEFAGNDEVLKDLKAADALLADKMEEKGESAVDADMVSAKDKLETMIADHMEAEGVSVHVARTAVMETKEGKALYKEAQKEG